MVVFVAFISAIALWTFSPDPSFAQRSSASVRASAHVAGVVIGKPVRSEQNVVLGTVENIVLNDTGCAQYLVVSGRFSGARARLFPMPWSVIARTGPDAIFVRVDERFLAQAPSFELNRWPDFSQSEWQTKIRTYYSGGAAMTGPGKEERPGAVRQEGTPKAQKQWQKPAAEGTAPSGVKEKEKARMEREHKGKTSEMGAPESSKQKQMDIRTKQQTQPKEGQMMRGPGMMEQGQRPMMQRGPSEMKMQKSPEKAGPAQGAAPVGPGQAGEKEKIK